MTKCKFCNEWKKPKTIMGPKCGYCKRCQKKPAAIMETIYGYCKECYKNPTNTMDQYASIATNEECQQLFVAHMRVLQEMPKKPEAIMGLICGYCIFENVLMKFIIEMM